MNSVNSEESDPHITQVINILLYQTLLLYKKPLLLSHVNKMCE